MHYSIIRIYWWICLKVLLFIHRNTFYSVYLYGSSDLWVQFVLTVKSISGKKVDQSDFAARWNDKFIYKLQTICKRFCLSESRSSRRGRQPRMSWNPAGFQGPERQPYPFISKFELFRAYYAWKWKLERVSEGDVNFQPTRPRVKCWPRVERRCVQMSPRLPPCPLPP